MKKLMLDHAFKFVETVIFHIGDKNIRSQKAIEKLGAIKIGEVERKNLDDDFHITLIYILDKVTWSNIRNEKKGKAK